MVGKSGKVQSVAPAVLAAEDLLLSGSIKVVSQAAVNHSVWFKSADVISSRTLTKGSEVR